jgi:mannose-6-phosphate isomerase-like protein (cupin superfamily)
MHELFIILEGTARMVVDGVPHDLWEGEAIVLAPGESHELSNRDKEPAAILVAGWIQGACE